MRQAVNATITAMTLVVVACGASGAGGATAETLTSATSSTDARSTIIVETPQTTLMQPVQGVEVGEECPGSKGRIGLTSSNQQLLCSGSTASGEPLGVPQWRDAAGRDFATNPAFTDQEAQAVDVARELDPDLQGEGDHAVAIMVAEYALALNAASNAGFPVDEAFWNLVDGVVAANGWSEQRGVDFTIAMIVASTYLLADSDPGFQYAQDMSAYLDSLSGG